MSSRSSVPKEASWILSPFQAFTKPDELLPKANSSETASAIGMSEVFSEPAATAGEHVPLAPGVVHIREPLPTIASSLRPNGLEETRLKVGEVGASPP